MKQNYKGFMEIHWNDEICILKERKDIIKKRRKDIIKEGWKDIIKMS